MNERIKELAKKAGADIWVAYVNPDGGIDEQEVYEKAISFEPPEKLEKFVELILQECIEQVYPQWIKDHPHLDPTNLADAVSRVKEHFGVEQ